MTDSDDRETGMACPCQDEHEPMMHDGVCPICRGRGWLTISEWRAAKLAGLLVKPGVG